MSSEAPTILIVEDERIVAKDLQQTLSGMGYTVLGLAASGEEALARAQPQRPDLVLMDIRIKGKLDGIETAELLRRQCSAPVVYLTAHADEATLERAKKTEPYGYVLKPVKAAELRSVIEIALFKHTMERQLRERERWFSTTLRSIADAVLTVDLAGQVTFMNGAAEQLTGVQLQEALGRPAREVLSLQEPASAPLEQALAQGRPITLKQAVLAPPGAGTRLVSHSASPVVDGGQTLGAVMVFRDITEQKLQQKQLELSDRLASLGTMAAGVAHEVNNPLAVIVVNSTHIQEVLSKALASLGSGEPADGDLLRALQSAQQAQAEIGVSAHRIGRLVSDLRAFSRPDSEPAGTADVARAVAWALRATSQEFLHRASVRCAVQEVPPVAMDESRLGRVLVQLLLNAAQALPAGAPDAQQVLLAARLDGERVLLEVHDTGCGMSPEVLDRAFEPFFTTRAAEGGTGLGLSVCRELVLAAGGEVAAQSQLGSGSTLRVWLPRARAVAAPPPPLAPAPRRGRVLVIDDEELVLRAIQRILKEHELVCVRSAREALSLLERGERFDVLLSDLVMPGMTGMELFQELQRSYPEEARRFVVLTGGALTRRIADFLASASCLRIEKPFEVEQLQRVVQQVLTFSAPP
jgi:PAS domain S-box-containing protein